MKTLQLYMVSLLVIYGGAQAQNTKKQFAKLPQPAPGEKVATFAGGCFWSLAEGLLELNGINKLVAGYAGGTVKNPSYEEVGTKLTGHAESVQVYYNSAIISYAALAEAFFYAHDPTTMDRQGPIKARITGPLLFIAARQKRTRWNR